MESTKEIEKEAASKPAPKEKPKAKKEEAKSKKEETKKSAKPEEEKKDSTRKDISDLLGTLGGGSKTGESAEEVKELMEGPESDLRIAVIGNVDSGKSTLVGVLTKGLLDDGRGAAR